MTRGYTVLDQSKTEHLRDPRREFALDVLQGLSERPKRLPSVYFYDAKGSSLFARIMDIPQYYLSDCEREILEVHAAEITGVFGDAPFNLVDLGAGDGRKTMLLLRHLAERGAEVRYVPIDVSEPAMAELVGRVREELPSLTVEGIVSEYNDGLRWLSQQRDARPNLVLLLGSNLGNFPAPRARGFLRRLWTSLNGGDRLLVGFDLKKDIDLLLSAYNDPQGVTAAFNLNLLERINRELGGNFQLDRFRHYGTYDVYSGAMISYLVSLENQTAHIDALGLSFDFEAWEAVHTEYSYKYLPADIQSLAGATGYCIENDFHDRRDWFVDSLWKVER